MLTHLIITRFNLRYPGSDPVSDEWLAHRLPIFRDFCYASVRGQTAQDFRWLVLFDTTTPAAYRAQIDSLTDWDNFTPVYIDGFDYAAIFEVIRAHVPAGTTRLLTTTLDNDDALAAGFIGRLQAAVGDQPFEIINFRNGYRLNRATDKLYEVAIPTNPFVSVCETVGDGNFLSIIGCLPHSTIPQRFTTIREIETEPLWLQVIHERNAAMTGIVGRKRTSITELEAFALNYEPAADESEVAIRLERVRGSAERKLIDRLPERLKTRLRNRG